MSINKILNSLDKSWIRDDVLLKIKNGIGTDEIINEFLLNNAIEVKELHNLLRPQDLDLLNQLEELSTCESKLINKISNLNYKENDENYYTINEKKVSLINRLPTNSLRLFMINWSNKFVVIALLTLSAIALSKQAWA